MKAFISLISFIILLSVNATAQFQARYETGYKDNPNSLDFADSGGYVVLSNYGIQYSDLLPTVIRSDGNGDVVWAQRYSLPAFLGTGGLKDIKASSWDSATYLVVGQAWSNYGGGPGIGPSDIFLMMINDTGDIQLARQYGTEVGDVGFKLISTEHPKFGPVFGILGRTVNTKFDVNMMLGDENGNMIRGFVYDSPLNQYPSAIASTTDDGFIIVGETDAASICDTQNRSLFLLKLDASLYPQWMRLFKLEGDQGDVVKNEPTGVQQDIEGNYIISGKATYADNLGAIYDYKGFLLKTDINGKLMWARNYQVKNYPGTKTLFNSLTTIRGISFPKDLLPVSDYVVAGYVFGMPQPQSEALMIKTNKNGLPIWAKTYLPNNNYNVSQIQDIKHGNRVLAFTGPIIESTNSSYVDINLVETDLSGNSGTDCEKDVTAISSEIDVCTGKLSVQIGDDMTWIDSFPSSTPIEIDKRSCMIGGLDMQSCVQTN